MKLNFDIVWFEDELTGQQIKEIESNSVACGFDVDIHHIEVEEEIQTLAEKKHTKKEMTNLNLRCV